MAYEGRKYPCIRQDILNMQRNLEERFLNIERKKFKIILNKQVSLVPNKTYFR